MDGKGSIGIIASKTFRTGTDLGKIKKWYRITLCIR